MLQKGVVNFVARRPVLARLSGQGERLAETAGRRCTQEGAAFAHSSVCPACPLPLRNQSVLHVNTRKDLAWINKKLKASSLVARVVSTPGYAQLISAWRPAVCRKWRRSAATVLPSASRNVHQVLCCLHFP